MSPEVLQRISILRAKSLDGSMTLEDAKEAIRLIRGDRRGAAASSDSARRAKAKASIKSADEMLDELGNI